MNQEQAKILIVEDEQDIREMIQFALDDKEFISKGVATGAEAEALLFDWQADAIILDWMLPEYSGIEFLKRLRVSDVTAHIPVIMLTAKAEEENKLKGFEAGADDYLTKPFSPRELLMRIRALLRRGPLRQQGDKLKEGALCVNKQTGQVSVASEALTISPTLRKLLQFFMEHPKRIYSRDMLLDHVWGRNSELEPRTVDVQVRRLREHLRPHGYHDCIQTVRGMGYQWVGYVDE